MQVFLRLDAIRKAMVSKLICSIINSKSEKGFGKSRQVMIVNKAYRYRIYPTTEQKIMFAKTTLGVSDSSTTRC